MLLGENLSRLGVPALSRDERVAAFAKLNLPMSARSRAQPRFAWAKSSA